MNTFLPYASFSRSAQVLDRQRLGKQRVEAWQILNAMEGAAGWRNHPATLMWREAPRALALYGIAVCDEWIRRGYKDTMRERFMIVLPRYAGPSAPWWLGWRDFHAAHRSNLLRKMPEYYGLFNWTEPHDLPYVWPGAVEAVAA